MIALTMRMVLISLAGCVACSVPAEDQFFSETGTDAGSDVGVDAFGAGGSAGVGAGGSADADADVACTSDAAPEEGGACTWSLCQLCGGANAGCPPEQPTPGTSCQIGIDCFYCLGDGYLLFYCEQTAMWSGACPSKIGSCLCN